jgi:hypothetical protein
MGGGVLEEERGGLRGRRGPKDAGDTCAIRYYVVCIYIYVVQATGAASSGLNQKGFAK